MGAKEFEARLRALIAGEIEIKGGFNEYVGHAEVLDLLLEVAPDGVRKDLQSLRDLMVEARDATGAAVLGIFPRLTDPELANVEGRISDWIAENCGIRYGDGRYEAGKLVGESRCPGWPGIGSPLTNNRYPYLLDTSASNYFSNRFWHGEGGPPGFIPVPRGGKVVFRGEYPRARYFAFHPNDFDTNTLPTLVDEDLDPDEGSANPYRGPVPEGVTPRFTAVLDFGPEPEVPARNTTYCGKKRNGEPNPAVFCILRTTGSVLGAMPPNSTGVLLPSVSVHDAEGNETWHCPETDPYPPGHEFPVETTQFAPLPIPDWRGLSQPGVLNVKSNWGLPYDLLASDDISYLCAPYSERWGEVFVLRAKAFSTPKTPDEPPYTEGKQIRAFTVTNYNFWAGIAVTSIVDHEIARDADGTMTLVIAPEERRPANATPENGCTWIDWGSYIDGQLSFRFLIRRNPLLVALRKAVVEGEVSDEIAPYVPKTGYCSTADFEREGWRAAIAEG
jgi:hypothetical protein